MVPKIWVLCHFGSKFFYFVNLAPQILMKKIKRNLTILRDKIETLRTNDTKFIF